MCKTTETSSPCESTISPVVAMAITQTKKRKRGSAKSTKRKRGSTKSTKRKTKLAVYRGKVNQTGGGLKKDDIVRRRVGKGYRYVSKKKSTRSALHPWITAVKKARAELNITGFQAVKKGTPLYAKAREIYDKSKQL